MEKIKFLIIGLIVGASAHLWLSSRDMFKPFDFHFVETQNYILFLQQSISLPVPMTDHTTSVWLKTKRKSENMNPWIYIGSVHTDPFNLEETIFSNSGNKLSISFPWGAALESPDGKVWEPKYGL